MLTEEELEEMITDRIDNEEKAVNGNGRDLSGLSESKGKGRYY